MGENVLKLKAAFALLSMVLGFHYLFEVSAAWAFPLGMAVGMAARLTVGWTIDAAEARAHRRMYGEKGVKQR